MSKTREEIAQDQQEYLRLCRHYEEDPRWRFSRLQCYSGHAEYLARRYKREQEGGENMIALEDLPPRRRWKRHAQIDRILRFHGYTPELCAVDGYEDEHGVTWWTGQDGEGRTNYIHPDGSSEFMGATEEEEEEGEEQWPR